MTMEVGFTGTRHGMTRSQSVAVSYLLGKIHATSRDMIVAHHGCCMGSDEEFAEKCDSMGFDVIGHPPTITSFMSQRATAIGILRAPAPYAVRNLAIVDLSDVMIATPRESQPQPHGGTWMTVRMALRALRSGDLERLYVIGPDGQELDHARWR